MKAKRKLLISMLAIVFVLLAVVATVAIAFALTQQTITTTLNIGYVVEDIDGTASATYTIGGVTESLTAMKGDQVIGDTLVFHAGDTEDAGNLMFPEGQIPLSATNDNIVIQYTYSNTGAKHYIASMSFDSELVADNMKVEYSINGTDYSTNRYAVVVPANTSNKSYWIKISIENKAKSASFTGDFKWLLSGCDEQEDSYLSLTSVEFQQANDWEGNPIVGGYSVSLANTGSYVGELVFPSSVNGDPVTTIAVNDSLTQEQRNQVTSVYIPDSAETIGVDAFSSYQNLQTVTFEQNEIGSASIQSGTGLTSIGNGAFSNCINLKSIKIPSTVVSIDSHAFDGCVGLISLEVASGNTTYHSSNNCIIKTAVKELHLMCKTSVIPTDGSVTKIADFKLSSNLGLTKLIIPSSITYIGECAFQNCSDLTNVIFEGSPSFGLNCFGNCSKIKNVTINSNSMLLFAGQLGNLSGEINITCGNNVTEIPDQAFSGCSNLVTLNIITSTITKIGSTLFSGCNKLTNFVVPNSVTTIKTGAFDGALALTSVTLGENVQTIGQNAFYYCNKLQSINIPASVIEIGSYAFEGCSALTNVVFENPNGWSLKKFDLETGEYIYSELEGSDNLSDSTTSASLLKNKYVNYFFVKN